MRAIFHDHREIETLELLEATSSVRLLSVCKGADDLWGKKISQYLNPLCYRCRWQPNLPMVTFCPLSSQATQH
jgi:hypothetical protein